MRRKEKKNSAYIYIRLYHTYQSYPLSSSKFLVFKFFLKIIYFFFDRAGSVAQLGKNLPAMREIWVQSLGWEDPLEKGKAPVFWPREFHGLDSPCGHKESDMT